MVKSITWLQAGDAVDKEKKGRRQQEKMGKQE